MSAMPTSIPDVAYHPRHVELVKKLAEKTRSKKISWKASGTGLNATVSGKLEISFVRSNFLTFTKIMSGKSPWVLFTIRDAQGNQVLSIDNPILPTPMEPQVQSAVREAVSELYTAIEHSLAEEIDKAIEVVDRI